MTEDQYEKATPLIQQLQSLRANKQQVMTAKPTFGSFVPSPEVIDEIRGALGASLDNQINTATAALTAL